MEIRRITPADALYAAGFKPTRVKGKGILYMKATICCEECSFEKDVLIGRDETVYHECNQGNVVMHIAELRKRK